VTRGRRIATPLSAFVACVTFAGCAQIQPAPESRSAEPSASVPAPASPSPAPAARASPETPSTTASREHGRISFYGAAFAGKRTASGDIFDPERLTMAHRTLPFGTRVRVTNLENRKSVEVVVNDRGPAVPDRIADLSAAAAHRIGMAVDGVVDALLEVLQPAKAW
jgi:rare lipoprotein A